MMRTIQTTATVNLDGTITLPASVKLPPGNHHIVLVIDETESTLNQSEIDAALAGMASDPDYQAEALQIEAEFATAQWEAFRQAKAEA